MIVYDLCCDNSHKFESWFASAVDFESQLAGGMVTCPFCGSKQLVKLPTAAHVSTRGGQRLGRDEGAERPQQYANVAAQVLATVAEYVIKHTEDVGAAFPEEARKMHYSEAPERKIRGTASAEQVAELRDEGIDVVPLPGELFGKRH